MSESKKVVLGVSGSIAAHKAIDLASLLTKAGCVVDVVLTRDAKEFVKSLPFQTLTRRRVITSLYDEEETGVAHIRAADEADLLLIAPATANTLAKLAHGLADDALGCVALALRPEAKVFDCFGDERQHVATPCHRGQRGDAYKAGRGVCRARRGVVVLRLRRHWAALARGWNRQSRP